MITKLGSRGLHHAAHPTCSPLYISSLVTLAPGRSFYLIFV